MIKFPKTGLIDEYQNKSSYIIKLVYDIRENQKKPFNYLPLKYIIIGSKELRYCIKRNCDNTNKQIKQVLHII